MDSRLVVARRELATLRSEKTIVLALLIQLFIAAFSSFLVVGLVSLYDPGSVSGAQVEVAVTGDARDELVDVARDQGSLSARSFESEDAAMAAFRERRVDAVLATERRDGRVHVRATAPDSSVETTLVVVQIRETLRAFERAERDERAGWLSARPLALPPEATSSPYYGFTYTVLVPLLLFLPVFIGGSLTVDSLTEEVDRGTLELLRVAPVDLHDIVDGKLVAAVSLIPAQASLWLGLLALNGTRVGHPFVLLVFSTSLGLLVCALAGGVALLTPERRTAQLLYSVGVLGLFGATTMLPRGPANTVARLAVESADALTFVAVGVSVVVAVGGYLGVRRLVARADERGSV